MSCVNGECDHNSTHSTTQRAQRAAAHSFALLFRYDAATGHVVPISRESGSQAEVITEDRSHGHDDTVEEAPFDRLFMQMATTLSDARSNLGKAAAASKLEPPSDITGADSEEPLEEGTDKSLQLPSRGRERSDNKVGALNAPDVLTCGVKAETTIFDHLSGVKYRDHLPQVAEKDVFSTLFPMNTAANVEILRTSNLNELLQSNVELSALLEQKRGTTELLNAVGQLYRVRGNTTVAIECFRKVLAMSPSDEEGLLNLCDTLFRLEKWTEAEEVIRYSLTHPAHRKGGQNFFALGRTLLAQGRNSEAIDSFKQCLQLSPNHHTAQAGLAVARSLTATPGGNQPTIILIVVCIVATLFFVKSAVTPGASASPQSPSGKSVDRDTRQRPPKSYTEHGGDRGNSTT